MENERIVQRRRFEGIVVSNKMSKTVVVSVPNIRTHKKYQKKFLVHKKFKAHDEEGRFKPGDKVIIEETKPLSKEKRWKVIGHDKNI